ncbi:hypothetical protein [Desulfitobacterium sp. AusDCA]|uniref:hypothetical protein n=1 Tax=Desulfitobacterium sp. AusDCA TaxID=3240383 RepID=UPI003DA6FB2D
MYTFKKENRERCNLVTMEEHIGYILRFCNMDFYNVGDTFKIQLFDKEWLANDEVNCIAEFDSKSMSNVVSQAINWIDEYIRS